MIGDHTDCSIANFWCVPVYLSDSENSILSRLGVSKIPGTYRWSTIDEVLFIHMRTTMVLTNDKGVAYHLRASGPPEPVHKETYRLLDISDPLGRLKTVATHL